PVELEGPKPPASALATNITGFGPNVVAPKKPVPPTKPVPSKSGLGAAAAKPAPRTGAGGSAKGLGAAPTPAAAEPAEAPAPLSADQLLQPPVAPKSVKPEQDP